MSGMGISTEISKVAVTSCRYVNVNIKKIILINEEQLLEVRTFKYFKYTWFQSSLPRK